MKYRLSTTISREGWYYLFVFTLVFGGAMLREINLLVILGGMLAGPLLLSRFIALKSLSGLAVKRKLPQGVCAGDLLMVNLTIDNTRRHLGSWAIVADDSIQRVADGVARPEVRRAWLPRFHALRASGRATRSAGRATQASVLFPFIPARQSRKGTYQGRIARRGRYRLGPLRLSTRFPFGLFRYTCIQEATATLTVFPRLGRLTRAWLARHHEAFAGTDRREQRPGIEGDFYGLRAWHRGDSRRWIHWRTTARAGELMVCQYEQPRNRDVAVVLDLWQPVGQAFQPVKETTGWKACPTEVENLELAVSFAATVVAELCRKGGSDVYLWLSDPQPRMTGGPASAVMLQDMMERLAMAEAQREDHLPALLEEAIRRIEPGTEIVLVSTRPVAVDDAARLGNSAADLKRRAAARQVRIVDTSSEELSKYFEVE